MCDALWYGLSGVRRTLPGAKTLMARRRVQFSPGEYYHVYNRGCNRENIFRTDENYLFLIGRLKEKVPKFCVSVIA